jgi:hypothetical protein
MKRPVSWPLMSSGTMSADAVAKTVKFVAVIWM